MSLIKTVTGLFKSLLKNNPKENRKAGIKEQNAKKTHFQK